MTDHLRMCYRRCISPAAPSLAQSLVRAQNKFNVFHTNNIVNQCEFDIKWRGNFAEFVIFVFVGRDQLYDKRKQYLFCNNNL